MTKKKASNASKKGTRQQKRKAIGLDQGAHRPIRRELVDYDYTDKLNDEQKDWLHRFTEEEVAANLQHRGEKFNKTEKEKKRIWKKNNDRNNDHYAKARAVGKLHPLQEWNEESYSKNSEDSLIELIDLKNSFELEFVEEFNDLKTADDGSDDSSGESTQ